MDKNDCFFIILVVIVVILLTLFGFSLCQVVLILSIGYLCTQAALPSNKVYVQSPPKLLEDEQILGNLSPHDLVDDSDGDDISEYVIDDMAINDQTGCAADNKIVEMARYRGKQHEVAMLGRYSNHAQMAKRMFEAELDAQENSIWWGRDQLECLQRSMQEKK